MLLLRWYRHAALLALASGLPLSAANGQGIPMPHPPLPTAQSDIATLRSAYVDAFNAKNAKALSAMFTPNAVVIGIDGSQTMGVPAIGKMFADSAPTWPHAVINSTGLTVFGALATDIGTWTTHPKAGGENVSRYMLVLRHNMNGWKIENMALIPMK